MPNNSRTTVQANPVGGALHDAPKRNTSELTFLPFEDPVCTDDGSIFDLMSIVPYIKRFWKHPVTRALLNLEDLMPLTFHKNSDGEFRCSVLNKVFMEFTRIVAVKNVGNLLTDELFARNDLLTIQNPNAVDTKILGEIDHIKKGLKLEAEG
ncbi:hypothetical protein GUJ93_ZPchr0012g18996 [Zizania palustris]|uniref:RING-type E3 ubiquitin transferase n=1 Tax=Zizania palustris TaxID=103762 RepID=A0A8J5WNP5_ZIZPA|nr:hypothetical protein GUJ93_ZPchr0012g18996 [Zizania palustris]